MTGSRIKRVDIETSQPVFTLDRIDLERTSLTSVYDILSELTTNGASFGLQVNSANTTGSSTVDMRNCGSNRTLVLVNAYGMDVVEWLGKKQKACSPVEFVRR